MAEIEQHQYRYDHRCVVILGNGVCWRGEDDPVHRGREYPPIPPTYAGEASDALPDAREDCGHQPPCPTVNNLEDARFWIRVLHRRSCRDAEHYVELLERLARLERPWWKRWR